MFDWFEIFNLQEFLSSGLESKTYEYFLEGIGLESIHVTKGNLVSVTFQDEFMPINFFDNNPYESGDCAVYLDESGAVWLGIRA